MNWTYGELLAENERLVTLLQEQTEKVRQFEHKFADNKKKLTPKEVNQIRAMHRHGLSQSAIADIYDVNPATISRTIRGVYHR